MARPAPEKHDEHQRGKGDRAGGPQSWDVQDDQAAVLWEAALRPASPAALGTRSVRVDTIGLVAFSTRAVRGPMARRPLSLSSSSFWF